LSQNQWRLGLRPRPHWGSLQHYPDPLAAFKGSYFKERGGEGGDGKGKREVEGKERRGEERK